MNLSVIFLLLVGLLFQEISGFMSSEDRTDDAIQDPDFDRDSEAIIRSRGFKCQVHHAVTQDGYILKVFRVLNPYQSLYTRGRPILLMHGLLGSSDDFVMSSGYGKAREPPPPDLSINPQSSNLAFELANAGYGELDFMVICYN